MAVTPESSHANPMGVRQGGFTRAIALIQRRNKKPKTDVSRTMMREARTESSPFALLITAIVATCGLLFNTATTSMTSKQRIFDQGTLFPAGRIVLSGIVLLLLFNCFSTVRASFRLWNPKTSSFDTNALPGGIVYIFLLVGEKAMLDEIDRKTRFDLETVWERIALYVGLTVQLIYNLSMIRRLSFSIHTARKPGQ